MKASKFSEAQIAFVLKQAEDRAAVAEVCRKAGSVIEERMSCRRWSRFARALATRRPGLGVHLARSRSLGTSTRRHSRLLAAKQADRQ